MSPKEKSAPSIAWQNMLWQGLIVLLLLSSFWLFKILPGWLVQREMKKQLALLQPALSPLLPVENPHAYGTTTRAVTPNAQSPRPSVEQIYAALRLVKDPELDLNVVDLGLIRQVNFAENTILVTMIVTRRFCPYQSNLVSGVKQAVETVAPGHTVQVTVDYTTTWTSADLTEEGKQQWERFSGASDAR